MPPPQAGAVGGSLPEQVPGSLFTAPASGELVLEVLGVLVLWRLQVTDCPPSSSLAVSGLRVWRADPIQFALSPEPTSLPGAAGSRRPLLRPVRKTWEVGASSLQLSEGLRLACRGACVL